MKRRTFLVGLSKAAIALSSTHAFAQQQLPVIGILAHGTATGFKVNEQWFREGLAKGGIEIGRHATLVTAFTEGRAETIPALAADLVARKVALIATTGDTATKIAKSATSTIPIVFSIGTDPVAQGLVASLNRPGANLTGVTTLNFELGQKRIEVLHEMLPKGPHFTLLYYSPSAFAADATREAKEAARRLGREMSVAGARNVEEVETALAEIAARRAGGVVIGADAFFNNNAPRLAALTTQHRLAAIYATREFALGGGLVSYGTDLKDLFRQQGAYAARVMKGERPADLPVQQAAKIEMLVNLKTAAALGLTVPQHLLARADEVIE